MPRRPKLGQHFLRDSPIASKIADLTPVEAGDLLIEIGPGQGRMTRLLAPRCRKLVAVEIDATLAERLQEDFQENPRVEILRQDILKTSLATLAGNERVVQVYVFGNLPYYITSPILHHLFGERQRIRQMTILVQQEVAERITAGPGSREYGYLSVFVQSFSLPRIVLEVPPGAFSPPPKVRSALVELAMVRGLPAWGEETDRRFQEFVQLCFREKRKTLLNNVVQAYAKRHAQEALEELRLDQRIRAEQLRLEQFVALFQRLGRW